MPEGDPRLPERLQRAVHLRAVSCAVTGRDDTDVRDTVHMLLAERRVETHVGELRDRLSGRRAG